jgi:Flp pilus assembly protein CpaB
VDVLSTRSEPATEGATRAQVVAEALLVLAVGGASTPTTSARSGTRRGGVTVAVTTAQGRELAEAELSSSLRLVLRNESDARP